MTDNDFQSVYDELHWDVMASFYEGRRINARGNLIQCAIEQAERKVSADEN
jgi:hypothetical protein